MQDPKQQVALSSIAASAGLTLAKGAVGLTTGSLAILSEAAHSLLDLAAIDEGDEHRGGHPVCRPNSLRYAWLIRHVEDTRALMGQDFWPYGFEPNVLPLETFLRYSHEQGLAKRLLEPSDLFAVESMESFKI